MLQAKTQCEKVQGKLSLEVKKGIERRFQPRDLQGDYQPSIFSFQQMERIHRTTWLINEDYRSRSFRLTIPTHSTFSCWKIRFKTQVSACSNSLCEVMLWIKEVEIVDSVDDSESSRSVQGLTQFPNFEMLGTRIASAMNKIIQNSRFEKKVSLEEMKAHKEDRFPRGRQIDCMIYDYFPVLGAHDTVHDHADLFTITLRNDDVQEFGARWNEILLSVTKIHLMTSWKVCTH